MNFQAAFFIVSFVPVRRELQEVSMTGAPQDIRVIIGLGNPGKKFENTRHNIGFKIVDALADRYHASWQEKQSMHIAMITIGGKQVYLVKPQTFMNSSGQVIPFFTKQGIKAENILVVHDELEIPFGQIKFRIGGSARGHNGLKSIIAACGDGFCRVRFGIDRPAEKAEVPDYVLKPFTEPQENIARAIEAATTTIVALFEK